MRGETRFGMVERKVSSYMDVSGVEVIGGRDRRGWRT